MKRAVFLSVVVLALLVAGGVALVRYDLAPSTESARDWVIIIYGLMGILFFLLLIVVLAAIVFILMSVRGSLTKLIDESVRPTLSEVQRTAENVRGTSEFIADTAVSPVIRVVAITRGVKRGLSSLAGIRSRRK
jgi:hypothetical protein